MDRDTTAGGADDWFRRARVVWAAMFTAIGLYGLVLMLVTGDGAAGEPVPQLRAALIALAVASCAASWLVHRRILPRAATPGLPARGDEAEQQQRFTLAVLSWGFAETVALYGFVLALIERSPWEAATFFVVAVLALLATRPRPELFR
jgi:F0F1-type ATP synthase membrane subunit c/vacuolar-type H+-ATPase subunit K